MKSNNNLKPMFNGSVLMNETAIHDQAVMNVLKSCSQNNFEFTHTWGGDSYNISDRDWCTKYHKLFDSFLITFTVKSSARML